MDEILIVAAEASSDLYARRLIEEMNQSGPPFHFFGVGSLKMKKLGCEIIEDSKNMAVVGLLEVLSHWSVIASTFNKLVAEAKRRKPRLALLLDYPDFNLRLAKKLRKQGIPVIYYVSPQIWAWRTSRVHLIKKIVNRMLVVFPFEKDFYDRYNVPVSFVGHPLLDELNRSPMNNEKRLIVREKQGLTNKDFLIALLPGSRKSELKYNLATQIRSAKMISQIRPQARFLLLIAPSLEIEEVRMLLPEDLDVSIQFVKDEPLKILQASDAAIVASGTATLVAGLAECPMVIMYKVSPITAYLARKLVKKIDLFGMVNLILGSMVVRELFQEEASPENLAIEILKYMDDSGHYFSTKQKLAILRSKLGNGGATERVVGEILSFLKEQQA